MIDPRWVFDLIKKHWKNILVVALILIGIIQTKRLNSAKEQAEEQLQLKDGELAKVSIELGKLRSTTNEGSRNAYRPPESKTNIVIKEDQEAKKRLAELDQRLASLGKDKERNADEIARLTKERDDLKKRLIKVEITASPWGFTLKPGLGAIYSEKIFPEIDVKFLYAYRYSLKVGATPKFIDVGVTRHVDDLIPFFNFQNLEVQVVYGKAFTGESRWGIGIRSNL